MGNMPQVILDENTTLEVGKFAGYGTSVSERDGEPVNILTVRFEVTLAELGIMGRQLHDRIAQVWDERRAGQAEKLKAILDED